MPEDYFFQPTAKDILLNTLTQLNLSLGATDTSYDVLKTSFSVHGISRATIKRISANTIMRTEIHLGRNSLLTLRVIGRQRDVDKIIANNFFNSVSR